MDWGLSLIVVLTLVFLLLFLGQWIAFALGTAGILGLYVFGFDSFLKALGNIAFNQINSFTLTAIPLFILTGEIVLRSGISTRFYKGVTFFMGRFPGGLLHSNIVGCAFFSAISGSSVATASAIGSVAIPEQKKLNYERKMIFGSLAAGGTLGILIPPSIPLIIYGVLAKESVATLFIAGVIPGLVLTGFFMLYILCRALLNGNLSPKYQEIFTAVGLMKAVIDVFPVFFLTVLILGGIYSGLMTPTEAAAASAVLACVLSMLYRQWRWENFRASVINSVRTTCMVLFIIIGAQILSYLIVQLGINRGLTQWVVDMNLTALQFIAVVTFIYLLLGMIMEGISMIYLTFPVLFPVVAELGIDPIWFGIYLVILIEISLITPPIGLNIFVIQGVSQGRPISEIVAGAIPYFFIILLFLAMIAAVPELVLWLPSQMIS